MSDEREIAELYRDIFEHDARGARILEDLHARFGQVRVHTDGGIDAVLKTFKSGAQAAVVGYILNQVAKGNGDRPINPDDQGAPEP